MKLGFCISIMSFAVMYPMLPVFNKDDIPLTAVSYRIPLVHPTENYFHIDNKRILLITIEQVITSVQIRYNLFYERANKLYDY